MSIPVIGTAIVANPYWLSRLLASVDYPVDNFVIINNNGLGEIDAELDAIVKQPHPFIKQIKVCHMPANVGCSGAWNLIIKCYLTANYWIITNDDVAFEPGLLEEIAGYMDAEPDLGMIHPNKGDFDLGSWDLFVIRDVVVAEFGLFDENLYPAYCEDADYIMRLARRPIKKIVGTNNGYLHGYESATNYYGEDAGSQTSKSKPEIAELLNNANFINFEYMTEKWGEGWRVVDPYMYPWDKEGLDIRTTKYDLNYIRRKYMGF